MKPFRHILTFLIIAALLTSLLPMASLPAAAAVDWNEAPVLRTIGHTDTQTYTFMDDRRDVMLLVPYSYPDPPVLNLSDGLNITYDPVYYNVVASVADISPIGGDKTIDGGDTAVDVTVTFSRHDDVADAPRWQTVYHVYVGRADEIHPTFTGTLLKEVKAEGSLNFTAADFMQFYSQNDGAPIQSISIIGSNSTFGTLKLAGYNYSFGEQVSISSSNPAVPNVGQFSFLAGATSKVLISSFEITAYADSAPVGKVILSITTYPLPKINSAFGGTVTKGSARTFTETDFTSHCNLFGVPLLSVEITPTNTAYGTWFLGTAKITETETVLAEALGSLSFSATAPGLATFTWSVTTMAGTSAAGAGTLTVSSPVLALVPYSSDMQVAPLALPITKGGTWPIAQTHFRYTPAVPLTYIKITALPAAADGTLMLSTALPKNDAYGYPAITANTPLPSNAVIPAAYINYLRLTTKSTTVNSQVSFMWTATSDVKVPGATWGDPTVYSVIFMTAAALDYTTDMNIPAAFTADAFVNAFPAGTGSPLSYVTFTVPDKNLGALFLNYDITKKTGTSVAAAVKYYVGKTPNLSNITFVPAKDYTGPVKISYTAYMENGKFLTGAISITVNPSAGGTLSYIADKNSALPLDARDFQSAFFSATGKALSHVYFTLPATNQGKLVYNRSLSGDYDREVASSDDFYVYAPEYLSLVTFIPYNNFTGRVTIDFTGFIENSSFPYTGKLVIFVVDSPAGIVAYPVRENGIAALSGTHFSEEFIGVTGSLLSYVTFTPPAAANGTLYYQYNADTQTGTKVAAATKYYDGKSPDISDISFMPPKDFTGTLVVPYKAFTVSGLSYEGKLKFTVYEGSSTLSYTTDSGKPLPMNGGDLSNAFYMDSDGKTLSYVTFETPPSAYGRFYYNYTSPVKFDSVVSSDKKYYVSASPSISNVAFVPQESYTGSFFVTYTGYSSSGTSYTGKIKITVRGVNDGAVMYQTNSATPVTFKAADFVAAFAGNSTYALSYVKFAQPYSSYGILYDNYNSQAAYNAQVLPTTNYYVNSLSAVTFVPSRDFSGVLAINYTAFDTSWKAFSGTVLITVKSSDIGTITYGTNMNRPVLFNSDDFNTAFMTKSGASLDHVTFTLPSASAGTLYLGYNSPTSYTSQVSPTVNYYRAYAPQLSGISFVPSKGFTGAVTIVYTAYTSNGSPYYGKIIINVGTTLPFSDMDGHEWAKEAVSHLYRNGIISDDGSGQYCPGVNMTRADFIVMIVNAFNLTGGDSDNFPDVPYGSYYYDAVAAAKALDIARGSSDGKFYPQSSLTRQDAMVIIVRALGAVGMPLTGSAGDLNGFSDASNVSAYAVESVAALVRTGLVQGTGDRLNPKSMISRAETAVMLYRIMTM